MSDSKSFRRKINIESALNQAKVDMGEEDHVYSLSPALISPWRFRDRQSWEMGNIELLANNINKIGQIEPIVVVKKSNIFESISPESDYTLIAGFRRWTACKARNISVKCFIKDLSVLEAATLLKHENDKEPVSEYSKGMYYAQLMASKCASQDEIRKVVGETLSTFNNYLAFSQIPQCIWEAVGDLSKISARTAAYMRNLINKNKGNIEFLISIAEYIAKGAGETTIKRLMISNKNSTSTKIYNFQNQELFSYQKGKLILSPSLYNSISEDLLLNTIYDSISGLITKK